MASDAGRPDVSVITVTYNSEEFLLPCVRSVYEGTRARLEYFVVDNASRRVAVLDEVERAFPQVRVIRNPCNLGFARANNLAIERAAGRYVLLLNGDCFVRPGAIDRMLELLDSRPDIGVLGSPLVYPDGRDQGVARRGFPTMLIGLFGRQSLLRKWFPANRISARFSAARDASDTGPVETDWVSGACLMVRREAIDAAGLLDPGYFMYWEDTDWCFRIKQAGWRIYCSHQADVVHYEGGSSTATYWLICRTTATFHKSAYRYYRQHINRRRLDPTHLAVIAALSGHALMKMTTLSLKRLAQRLRTLLESPGR